jgi:alpha/beta superfamily hydrolase
MAMARGRLLRSKGKAPVLLPCEPHALVHGHREHHVPQLLAERWPWPHDERAPE